MSGKVHYQCHELGTLDGCEMEVNWVVVVESNIRVYKKTIFKVNDSVVQNSAYHVVQGYQTYYIHGWV